LLNVIRAPAEASDYAAAPVMPRWPFRPSAADAHQIRTEGQQAISSAQRCGREVSLVWGSRVGSQVTIYMGTGKHSTSDHRVERNPAGAHGLFLSERKEAQMSRKIVAGIVAGALALGGAACGTEVEEKGSATNAKEKAASADVEEQLPEEKPAPSEVAKELREEQKANPPSEEELEAEIEDLITPELIVDVTFESNPGYKRQFCRGYELLGYKPSLRLFASGYGHEPGYPPARVVFEEALSRC
jgi:hypothetical protein